VALSLLTMLPWPAKVNQYKAGLSAQRRMLRTTSAGSVMLRLQSRGLEILVVDLVGAGAHVSCASATVRHTASWSVGYFGFVEHVCGRAGQAEYVYVRSVAFGGDDVNKS